MKLRCYAIALAFLLSTSAVHAAARDVLGDWSVEGEFAHVRIADCGGSLWGVNSWEKSVGGTDKNNPDQSKRSRPTLGIVLISNMRRDGNKEVWKGKIYNAQDGKTYDASMQPGATADTLKIEGCVLGFLCGGQTWKRVAEPAKVPPPKAPGQKSGTASAKKRSLATRRPPMVTSEMCAQFKK